MARVFGRNPVVASAPTNDRRIKDAAQRVYASLGAQMTVLYHEEGMKLEQPFEYVNGLLVRLSDFSVTRNTIVDGTENSWWNMMSKPNAAEYHPLRLLELGLERWNGQTESSSYKRVPFITALIHENNFYRSGTEGWTSIYFTLKGSQKGGPLPPPWNLNAPNPSRLRSAEDQTAIWQAYEEFVAYAANLNVVTSDDIVRLAVGR
ncbi:MAG: hypothetical protein N2049_07830 [Anaerolineales bacterium]|nr:hypothetical protein [Anaerolineales bacterium]